MFKQKIAVRVVLIIVSILILIASFWFFIKKPPQKNISEQNGNTMLNSEKIEKKVIESKGLGFKRFIPKEGTELIIAPYNYTTKDGELLESYGILVFEYNDEKIVKIDQIKYNYGTTCRVYFSEEKLKDFNNDGVKELVIEEGCQNGSVLWVYIWLKNSLKLINSVISDSDFSAVTFDNNTIFADIDNDGKLEASLIYKTLVRLGPGSDDIRIDIYKQTYKWDGTDKPYYLWKEEKIGEEKPEL